jgi:hypothetical protein
MLLIVQSKDGGDEAFLKLTADEICALPFAMACAEKGVPCLSALNVLIMVVFVDTPVEYLFDSVKEDNPMAVR